MNRHFNTHIEGLDLQFWHGVIEKFGVLRQFHCGEYGSLPRFGIKGQ